MCCEELYVYLFIYSFFLSLFISSIFRFHEHFFSGRRCVDVEIFFTIMLFFFFYLFAFEQSSFRSDKHAQQVPKCAQYLWMRKRDERRAPLTKSQKLIHTDAHK